MTRPLPLGSLRPGVFTGGIDGGTREDPRERWAVSGAGREHPSRLHRTDRAESELDVPELPDHVRGEVLRDRRHRPADPGAPDELVPAGQGQRPRDDRAARDAVRRHGRPLGRLHPERHEVLRAPTLLQGRRGRRQRARKRHAGGAGADYELGIRASFAGSAIRSISVIRPSATLKPTTAIGFVPGTTITPALPFTIAGRACGAKREPRVRILCATASAPLTVGGILSAPRSS